MTPLIFCLALAAGGPTQHPTPPAKPAAAAHAKTEAPAKPETPAKAEPKTEAAEKTAHAASKPETAAEHGKADAAKPAAAAPAKRPAPPADAAARILERLDKEFPYKTPETPGGRTASKTETRASSRAPVAERHGASRVTLSWRITLTWPTMR